MVFYDLALSNTYEWEEKMRTRYSGIGELGSNVRTRERKRAQTHVRCLVYGFRYVLCAVMSKLI